MNCNSCKFWNPNTEGTSGQCHAIPPQCAGFIPQQTALGQQFLRAIFAWPDTNENDFCGNHQPKQAVITEH